MGYQLGLTSEHRIALHETDSLATCEFIGYAIDESSPDHSPLSRTLRQLLRPLHESLSARVLEGLREADLVRSSRSRRVDTI